MTKVAVIGCRTFPARYGGIETVCEHLYTGLAKSGFEILMLCQAKTFGRKNTHPGITVINFPTLPFPGINTFFHCLVSTIVVTFSTADIIHFHAQGPAIFSFIPKIFAPSKRIIFTCQGIDWKRDKWSWFARNVIKLGERNSARFTDERIAVSKEIRQYYREVYKSESILLSNGTSLPNFVALNKIADRFNIRKHQYILFTGRLVPEKRVDILLEAFRQVESSIKLVIAGDYAESKKYGRPLVDSCLGDDRIVFTSRLDGEELKALYSNALAYISASCLEGNPLSVIEAMSHGLPVILSDIPSHKEILTLFNHKPVIGFKVDDVNSCRESIELFLKLSNKDVSELSTDSRQIVEKHFSIDNLVRQTKLIYSRLATS